MVASESGSPLQPPQAHPCFPQVIVAAKNAVSWRDPVLIYKSEPKHLLNRNCLQKRYAMNFRGNCIHHLLKKFNSCVTWAPSLQTSFHQLYQKLLQLLPGEGKRKYQIQLYESYEEATFRGFEKNLATTMYIASANIHQPMNSDTDRVPMK
nr:hypothetical protein [Tanacetum cinerariifolium]